MNDDVDSHFAEDDGVGYADIDALEWCVTNMMEDEGKNLRRLATLSPDVLH